RRRRNAKTYRYQKKQRKQLKLELMSERGGQCEACSYRGSIAALEFHHRDPGAKEFRISSMSVSRARLWLEAAKCELLCANCHREVHAGARRIAEGLPGLAEATHPYAA